MNEQGREALIAHMTNRFLGWRLPDSFGPDGGIAFAPNPHPACWPTGTNLLTYEQAKAMFEYALDGAALAGRQEVLQRPLANFDGVIPNAMLGYLRRCSSGGMPKNHIDIVQANVDEAERLGYFKLAIAEAMLSASPPQPASAAREPLTDEQITAIKEDAQAIFCDTPCNTPQIVSDMIEWYDSTLRAHGITKE